jgi:uroporphyrinogen-III synthase
MAPRKFFLRLSNNPLAGRGIVITRPVEQARRLAALVEAAGGRALLYPAIGIEDPADPAPALRAIGALESFDLVIFISPTAVRRAFGMMQGGRPWPAALRAAAVGPGSARELERHAVRGALVAESGAGSEALLALPEMARMSGKRVLIFRGEGGRELLGDTLKARGAQVEYAECYRRVRPRTDIGPLLAAWEEAAVHAVTVSSAAGLTNIFAMLGEHGALRLRQTPVFAAHDRVADAARRHGVREVVLAGTSDEEMLERLMAYFSHR